MSDSQSIHTSLLEVMIPAENESVVIRDLSNLTFQIIFDAMWPSMNVSSKCPIARSNSRHAPSVALLFALRNCGDWQPRHHMYHLSSSSSPSIRTWDQLHGETLAGKSAHGEVKQINRVGGFWIEQYNHWWNCCSHVEYTRQLWNYNSQLAKKTYIRQLDSTYINPIGRQNALNWQRRAP